MIKIVSASNRIYKNIQIWELKHVAGDKLEEKHADISWHWQVCENMQQGDTTIVGNSYEAELFNHNVIGWKCGIFTLNG